jgi:chromosome segregation ATPase
MVVWKRPKPSVPPIAIPTPAGVTARLRPEHLRSFLDAYDEKRRIMFELDSLETRARKGKIPRRRYRVQKVTLETRLNALSRNLAESKDRLRAAGGKYADLARQLEIAETEMNEVESNIKSIEARHNRGELSLEAYRKLLGDYQRRKEKSDTTIKGILLRFREEIH